MRFRVATFAVTPLVSTVLLAGCTTTSGTGASGGLFAGRSSEAVQYISALQGGMVGRSGISMSDSDRQRALEAEYRALESAGVGQPIEWSGSSITGEVVAAAPYQVGSQNCRQYKHTLTVSGRETTIRGAGCRNADGTWTPLT